MKPNKLHTKKLLAAILALSGGITQAQTTPAAPAAEGAEDEVLVLTPFVVTVDNDQGYSATNTLAGSRLNTNLKDTPATIDIFTTEFLNDIGATDLVNVLEYANNSQLEVGDTQRAFNGIEAVTPGSTKFRSRGLNASLARNYFKTNLNPEFYITDRLDESRGPNSILFGVGAAGGIINIGTKDARLNKTATTLGAKFDDNALQQYTLDHNQVIAKNKLALRLNAMTQDKGSWRFNEDSERNGLHLAIKAQPFRNTVLNAAYETGDRNAILARNWTIRDAVSAWWDNEITTGILPTNGNANSLQSQGIARFGNNANNNIRNIYIDNTGLLIRQDNQFWQSVNSGGAQNLINRPDRVLYEANASGPGATSEHNYDIFSASIEQKITKNLFAEVAFQHEKADWDNFDAVQDAGGTDNAINLRGDPNQVFRQDRLLANLNSITLTPGTVGSTAVFTNPNSGDYYIDTAWRRRRQNSELNNIRASLAYEFDLGKAGSHRLAGMIQESTSDLYRTDEHEYFIGTGSSDSDSFLLWRRNYVGLGVDNVRSFHAASWANRPAVSYIDGSSNTFISDWRAYQPYVKSEETNRSALLALQSYFFNRRLVTTAGYRYDNVESERVKNTRVDGFTVLDYASPVDVTKRHADTKSVGAVYHVTKNKSLSVFVNASSNIDLPDFNIRYGPDGGVPPNAEGKTFDTGLMFDLLEGKISGRITYYDSDVKFQTQQMGVNNTFGPGYNNIMAILENPDGNTATADSLYTPAMLANYSKLRAFTSNTSLLPNGDSLDNASKGYEASFTINPNKNLRISLKYSYTTQDKTNAYAETLPRFVQLVQLIDEIRTARGNVPITGATLNVPGTANASITSLDVLRARIVGDPNLFNGFITGLTDAGSIADRTFDFQQANGGRKHKANIFGKYFFRDGFLNGFSLGGGVRYQSKIQAGVNKSTTTIGEGTPVYGSELFYVDALVGYDTKLGTLFGKNTKLELQLNVRNLLNEEGIIRMRYNDDGVSLNRFVLETPREYVLSANIKF